MYGTGLKAVRGKPPSPNPYLALIKNCNRIVDSVKDLDSDTKADSIEKEDEDQVPQGPKVAEPNLAKFLARDAGGQYQTFGYFTQDTLKALAGLPWIDHGFEIVDNKDGHGICAVKEVGLQRFMNGRLLAPITCETSLLAFAFLQLCLPNPAPYVPLLGGPSEVRVPTHVSYLLGAARHEIHMTIYTRQNPHAGLWIWVKKRGGTDIYPGAFEHAYTTTIEQGEDEEMALERLYGDRDCYRRLQDGGMGIYKQVSYFTIGGQEAGRLLGVADAGIISCYSAKVDIPSWSPKRNSGVCQKYTLDEVKEQLLRGEWTPGSALSMKRWLIERRYLGLLRPQDYTELETRLYRQLPHWRAMDVCPDRSKSVLD